MTATSGISGTAQRRQAFAAAGLPIPVYPKEPVQRHDSNAWDTRIGVLTHRVIGAVAPQAQHLPSTDHPALVRTTVGSIVTDRSLGRLDRARTRVTGLTTQYLREFLPPPTVEFLGAELTAGRGRVDLAWSHPTLGVWFDEVKTWRHTQAGLDEPTWQQITRYLDAGTTTYSDEFVGVRLLTLGNLRGCIAINRQGLIEDLTHSSLSPSLLALGGAA